MIKLLINIGHAIGGINMGNSEFNFGHTEFRVSKMKLKT